MSDGVMTYEDWLRGCVYHDGRHGYVTLPCEEVLKIADFIERLKADRKTEPQTGEFELFDREALILLIECQKERIAELLAKTEPQTETSTNSEKVQLTDEPQTDCSWK